MSDTVNSLEGDSKTRLLWSSAIHELRTHLTAIIASADLLAEQLPSKPSDIPGRLIRSISRNAQSMNKRLSQLSDAYGSTDVSQPSREDVPVGRVIREVSSLLSPVVQSRNQELTIRISEDLLPVQGNRQYVSYILLTLVHNASKFTPSGGSIRISARNEGDSVVVQVEDSGIGIPEEERESIFEPRRRLLPHPTKYTGSGLGLATAKFLVEMHGGRLWLDSEVGKGSSFFFALPAVHRRQE